MAGILPQGWMTEEQELALHRPNEKHTKVWITELRQSYVESCYACGHQWPCLVERLRMQLYYCEEAWRNEGTV